MSSGVAEAPSGQAMAEPAPLLAQLSRYRDVTLQGLLAAVPNREPRQYLYDPLAAHLSRVGKSIRPAICMATCVAFGGKQDDALQSALALEMLHNAFLVHDDVEDESELRRGKPTMHTEHGIPLAVNAGDTLNALSLRLFRDNLPVLGQKLTWRVFEEVDHMMLETLEGQALELGWIRDKRCDINEEDYLRMTLKKTCWYSFIHPCRIGALIATRDGVDLDRFNRFGFYLGAAFQIQDDLLNLVGEQNKYGKEIGGDLLEGKRTLMLVHLVRNSKAGDAERVQAFLSEPRRSRSPRHVDWILEQMHGNGSIDYARSVLKHLAGAALYEFTHAYRDVPDSEEKMFMQHLVDYMVSRDV
jgi:geranylgeranyl diphosphate synthase, type II